jgi:predicted dehydrogenase
MLKVGVLGAGSMGGTHARAFARLPDVQVVGVSSRSAEKAAALAKEVNAEPFTDAMALATAPHVDAVSVTLPNHLHQEYVVAALNAGKHALVEKPMGLTVEECDAMIEAAHRSGRLLMVAHAPRFWPEYVALADLVRSGQLGRPLVATASRLSAPPTLGSWFANPAWTGGVVHDLQIHDLDIFNWLFGAPQSVYARGQRGIGGGWAYALTLVDYGAVQACAEGSWLMPAGYPFTMTLRVLCEKGSVEFASRASGADVGADAASGASLMVYESGESPRPLPGPGGDGYQNEITYFVQCVREGRTPDQGTVEQGRLAVKTALAVRRSLDTGQVVSIPAW